MKVSGETHTSHIRCTTSLVRATKCIDQKRVPAPLTREQTILTTPGSKPLIGQKSKHEEQEEPDETKTRKIIMEEGRKSSSWKKEESGRDVTNIQTGKMINGIE